jgi:hypothetical protein
MGGGLTTWAHGLTARLCSEGSLTAWAHGLTASLYSGSGQTTQTRGLTASRGQRWKAQWNTGADSGAGMGAAQGESSYRKMSKLLVRRCEAEKGKSALSKTCQETMM